MARQTHYDTNNASIISTMALQTLSRDFLGAFESRNYADAARLIPQIKLEYAKTGLLSPSTKFDTSDLVAARQLLEMAVIVSIYAGRPQQEVERLISEVRPFYSPALKLPPSENETKLVGLYLLLALTGNRVSEFHTELENIENPENDKYLRYPVRLERWLMEGAYDKAWNAVTDKAQFPAPEFALLMQSSENSLEATIQNEIALCAESAYSSLPATSAKHIFYLPSDAALEQFVAARAQRGWKLSQQRVTFKSKQKAPVVAEEEETAGEEELIDKMLDYAAKIEVII